MKKVFLLFALLAMVAFAAMPAFAHDESGDVESATVVSVDGNNNNQCVGIQNVDLTGDVLSQLGLEGGEEDSVDFEDLVDLADEDEDFDLEDLEDLDDFNFGDEDSGQEIEIDFPLIYSPENTVNCEQAVDQNAEANSWYAPW